jgi:hypothetical protein
MPIIARRSNTPVIFATVVLSAALVSGCGSGGSSPTAPDTAGPTQNPATATSLTFAQDVQPILNSDCVSCHGSSRQEAGFDFRTYTGVMRAVTPVSNAAILVRATQPGGIMYQEFRGSAAAKAETIRRWVVDFKAVQ